MLSGFPNSNITPQETHLEIAKLKDNQSPSLHKVDAKIAKLNTKKSVLLLMQIYNAMLWLSYSAIQ